MSATAVPTANTQASADEALAIASEMLLLTRHPGVEPWTQRTLTATAQQLIELARDDSFDGQLPPITANHITYSSARELLDRCVWASGYRRRHTDDPPIMFELPEGMPWPEVDATVYVGTSDDYSGGRATIKRIVRNDYCPNDYNRLSVVLAEHPGCIYNWRALMERQDEYRASYGDREATTWER